MQFDSVPVLALILVGVLTFGGIVHSYLPHSHSGNEAITETTHAALLHEDKKLLDFALLVPLYLPFLVTFVCLATFRRRLDLLTLHSIAYDSKRALLHRGVLPYRAFP